MDLAQLKDVGSIFDCSFKNKSTALDFPLSSDNLTNFYMAIFRARKNIGITSKIIDQPLNYSHIICKIGQNLLPYICSFTIVLLIITINMFFLVKLIKKKINGRTAK
jgi:hypothetical protein